MHRKIFLFINLLFIFSFLLPGTGLASSPSGINPLPRNPDSQNNFLPMVVGFTRLASMVYISAGEFQMGCDPDHNGDPPGINTCYIHEFPLHTVFLDDYYIDKNEVTNDQMAAFLNSRGGNDCDGNECVDLDAPYGRISWNGSQYMVKDGYNAHPVVEVTWYGADAYCKGNNKHLPSEAEWEKAARGATARAFPWGDDAADCSLTNFYGCIGHTLSVGSYPTGASPYGARDMAGNVWEWVNDWYEDDYYSSSPASNPPGPAYGRYKVIRGGSYADSAQSLRTSDRAYIFPDNSETYCGFRCAVETAAGP